MEQNDYKKKTESVFTGTTVLCLLAGIFFGQLLDAGLIIEPAVCFYFPMAVFLFFRYIWWKFTGSMPELTKIQEYTVSLMPLYGFAIFFVISSIIRQIRFN